MTQRWFPWKTSPMPQSPLPAAPATPPRTKHRSSLTCGCQDCGCSEQPSPRVTTAAPKEARGNRDEHQYTKAKEHRRPGQSIPSTGRLPAVFTTRGQGAWCHLDPGQGKEINSEAQNFPEVLKGSWMPQRNSKEMEQPQLLWAMCKHPTPGLSPFPP